jgi:DGQHR domain-containing protein
LLGYQRAAVQRHIRNIADYLDSEEVLFPNSLILALGPQVRFRGLRGPRGGDGFASVGTLDIPLPKKGGPKLAWVVDGQQRTLALARSSRRSDFPVVINAFVAESTDFQREQFLRVNSAKPLPRGLITELLPEMVGVLPPRLAARRIPSALCDLLNDDGESPFRGLIRRSSMDGKARARAVVADTAIVQMIQDSLSSAKGCLFTYRNVGTGAVDLAGIRRVLLTFWNAVHDEFPEAWGLPAARSRLMHGAGIRAMGRVMDHLMKVVDADTPGARVMVRKELACLRTVCRWTSGSWDVLNGMRWNEIQNVPSHVRALGDALVRTYLRARADR